MKIRYFGHACFEIVSNKGLKVITDPYTKVGYELPQGLTADILTVSHGHFDHNFTQAVASRYIVSDAKSYLIEDVECKGIFSYHDPKNGVLRGENIIYKVQIDGFSLCHLGDIGEECSETLAKELGEVDVLFIPVGGTYTIDAAQAFEYIEKLSPKLVIPMHYLPTDGMLDIAPIEDFFSSVPADRIIPCTEGEFTLNKTDLQSLIGKIIYMERRK